MKKYFITSDIHSFYTIWMDALIKAGFDIDNKEHILIIIGDVFDRGDESKQLLDFLTHFDKERLILIRGNHEDLFLEMIYQGYSGYREMVNGTFKTYRDLFDRIDIMPLYEFKETDLYKLITNMIDYYETDNYIFTHGFLPTKTENGKTRIDENFRELPEYYWHYARWTNGMEEYEEVKDDFIDKYLVVGHFHTSYGHANIEGDGTEFGKDANFDIYRRGKLIAIDACTAFSKRVNVLVLNEDEI